MDVYVLFAQRKEQYSGEFAPEALTIIDEFTLEECGLDRAEEDCIEQWHRNFGDQGVTFEDVFVARAWVKVAIDTTPARLRQHLMEPLQVAGHITYPPEHKGSHPSYGGISVTYGRTPKKIQDSEITE